MPRALDVRALGTQDSKACSGHTGKADSKSRKSACDPATL